MKEERPGHLPRPRVFDAEVRNTRRVASLRTVSVAPHPPSLLRSVRRPLPAGAGRGVVIRTSAKLNGASRVKRRQGQHLAPLLRGEVAASLRLAGAAAGEGHAIQRKTRKSLPSVRQPLRVSTAG